MSNQQLVENYFAACNSGDPDAVARHFCADAVVYDLNHEPVTTAAGIGEFYARVRDRWKGATWHVNTYVEGPAGAAIEWTMRGVAGDESFEVRGSEHYEFSEGAIAQIRQYWKFDHAKPGVGLRGYPYAEDRRFSMEATAGAS